MELPAIAREMGYQVPTLENVAIDFVTPTCNREAELLQQGERLGQQIGPNDRWIVVNDAGPMRDGVPAELGAMVGYDRLMFLGMSYKRGQGYGTINRARHAGCSLARPGAWIVELDDHDWIEPGAIDRVRRAIAAGAMFVYGDTLQCDDVGRIGPYAKEDYRPYLLRDSHCPCEGVRAFPQFLYAVSGGYRFYGDFAPNGNEFPAGDYGLFLRLELLTKGSGFVRVPAVLCRTPKVVGGISTRFGAQQANMAHALRSAAQAGTLI